MKFTQKEIKSPDKFRRAISDIIAFSSTNYKKIAIILGLILIIIIGILAFILEKEKRELRANNDFREAVSKYSANDLDKALELFSKFNQQHPQSKLSYISLYYIGVIYLDKGEYDNSISKLSELLKSDLKEKMLIDAATYTIGLAYFKKGNWQESIDYLSRLETDKSPFGEQARIHTG
ncbi:MAG: tetratricopeptide repeat protein, partial [Thermodesulfobacteriota bacterium]